MPFFKVTLAENIRYYHKHPPIDAATAEEAAETARKSGEWSESDLCGDAADADEPTFLVDECDEDGGLLRNGKNWDIDYPGYVYKSDLERFARKVAALGEEGAYDNAITALDEIIQEARLILGITEDTAAAEKTA